MNEALALIRKVMSRYRSFFAGEPERELAAQANDYLEIIRADFEDMGKEQLINKIMELYAIYDPDFIKQQVREMIADVKGDIKYDQYEENQRKKRDRFLAP
ncbi:MAG: hypothetical protein WC444_04695 [Candidatus Paceibacterota bacterium]